MSQEFDAYPMLLDYSAKDYIWGGTRLAAEYGKKGDKIAETWELSLNDFFVSTVQNGECKGYTLTRLYEEHPECFGEKGLRYGRFPLLVKFIDAETTLSIQVHPSDEYALLNEYQLGKREMWYILSARDDAEIYLGLNRDVTKEELAESIKNDEIESLLNRQRVKKGDCYLVNEGTLHAIRGGMTLLEVQENSNVTYRVYDYNRKDKNGMTRELHVDKAVAVTDRRKYDIPSQTACYEDIGGAKRRVLIDNDFFNVTEYVVSKCVDVSYGDSFTTMTVVDGEGTVNGEKVKKGNTLFLPCDLKCRLEGTFTAVVTGL